MEENKKPKSKIRKVIEIVGYSIFGVLIIACSAALITSKIKNSKDNSNAPTRIGNLYLPVIVSTNSMEPKYMTGSAIFIKKVHGDKIYNEYTTAVANNKEIEIDLTFNDNYCAHSSLTYVLNQQDIDVLESYGKSVNYGRTTQSDPKGTMTHRLFYVKVNEGAEYGKGKYYFFVNGINDKGVAAKIEQWQVFTENELYGRVYASSKLVGKAFTFVQTPIGLIVLLFIPCAYMIVSSVIDIFKKDEKEEHNKTVSGAIKQGLSQEDRERLKKQLLEQMLEEKKKEKEEAKDA